MNSIQSIISLFSVIFVLSCFFIGEGTAIQCYECNSHLSPECALDIPPPSLAKNCTDTENKPRTMCRKITQIIEFEVNGLQPDTRVIRGCGWDESNYVNKCYHRSGFGGRQEVCSCKTDLCNKSTPSASISGHMLLFVSAIMGVYYFNV